MKTLTRDMNGEICLASLNANLIEAGSSLRFSRGMNPEVRNARITSAVALGAAPMAKRMTVKLLRDRLGGA